MKSIMFGIVPANSTGKCQSSCPLIEAEEKVGYAAKQPKHTSHPNK